MGHAGVTAHHTPGVGDHARQLQQVRLARQDLFRALGHRQGQGAEEVLAGETDLLELAGVVAHAGRVVCGDTGVAHLATAFGTPSVVLFGPTPPSEWGPPPDRVQHVALWAGRRGDPHADRPHAGLLELTVDAVLDAVRAQSGSNPSAVAGTSRACMLRSINSSEAAARSGSMCATASGATATSKWRT